MNNNIRFTAESKHDQVTTYNCVNHHHPQHGVIMYGVRTYIHTVLPFVPYVFEYPRLLIPITG